MPSEFSVYRKIQVVLEVAKSLKVETVAELLDEIQGLKPDNFLTRRYDSDQDSFIVGISETSISRIVELCRQLNLIRDNGRLSEAGRRASRKTQFDATVASEIREYLQEHSISVAQINQVISRNLRAEPPVLTTIREIWLAVGEGSQYSTFSRMLILLAQCGGAEVFQKKIYLKVSER